MGIRLVFFDLDGVLINSQKMCLDSFEKTFKRFGYQPNRNFIKNQLGLSSLTIIKNNMPKEDRKIHDNAKRIFDNYCSANSSMKNIDLNKNAEQVLEKLDKRKILLTNSDHRIASKIIEHFDIKKHFEKILASDDFVGEKEDEIKRIMQEEKISPKEIIYIGDMKRDVNVAKNAGCISVIINNNYSWGEFEKIEKAEPDYIIHDLKELLDIVDLIDGEN